MRKTGAIILSAGKGTRAGGKVPKQYILLDGKPMLYYALKAFELSRINEVVVVCGEDDISYVKNEIIERYGFNKAAKVTAGGRERYDSVMNGLKVFEGSGIETVLIHDGARPFVSIDIINEMAEEAYKYEAAIAAMPVKDTIKLSDDEGFIKGTTERKNTWMAQTPQAFKYSLIYEAYRKALGKDGSENPGNGDLSDDKGKGILPEGIRAFCDEKNATEDEKKKREALKSITDDAMIFEQIFPEKKIKLVPAGYENIKITTNEDLKTAEYMLKF